MWPVVSYPIIAQKNKSSLVFPSSGEESIALKWKTQYIYITVYLYFSLDDVKIDDIF